MRDKYFTILIIFIALAITGCALIPLLPVRLAPSDTLPSLSVKFSMPGNSARSVENEVTSRLESVLARINGVKDIESRSYNGGGRVTVSFDRHSDMEHIRFEVSTIVRQIWNDLPEGVSYPAISLRNVDNDAARPFITLTLNAPANPADIQNYGEENLKPSLSRIAGVAKVDLSGAQPMEWRLRYDVDRIIALGITPYDIQSAIREHFSTDFIGMALADNDGNEEWLRVAVKATASGSSFNPNEIMVTGADGKKVTLDRIAETMHSEARPEGYFRVNGLNSIYVNITAAEDANQLKLAEEIWMALDKFKSKMPGGYMVDTVYDATEEIKEELDKIYFRSSLTVLILLLFVGLVSLSLRYVLLITIGLAINLAVAVLFYYFAHVEIQLYSLAGITISLNLVIDNLIVMTDHYTRRRSLSVFTAILAATLTTVGALSVVFFMDEKTRLSLQDFVAVVIINLLVSLFVALFLVPALVERLGIHHNGSRRMRSLRRRISMAVSRFYSRLLGFIIRFRVAFIILALLGFGLPVFMIPEKIESESRFAKTYNSIFGSEIYRNKVKPIADKALGGTLRLFVEKVYNGSYWDRTPGEPVLQIYATLPNGATLEQMNALISKMEVFLSDYKEIRQFQTSISNARRATISIYFVKDHQHDGFPYRLKGDVVSKAITLGGGSWSVYGLEDQGFSNDLRENAGSYRVKLTGYNYDELYDWAYRMRDSLLTQRRIKEVTVASEFSFFKDDYTEFHLAFDRDRIAAAGIDVRQLFDAIQPTFGRDINCGSLMIDNNIEEVSLYSAQGEEYDIFTLMHQPFAIGGRTFKLSDFGTIEKRNTPQDVVKVNQEYVMCLQYEYIGSNKQGDKVLDAWVKKFNSMMPVGYKVVVEKYLWRQDDDKGKYWLLALVIAIIFFITSILFNSLRMPFAVILIIPVSFIGVFAVFYLYRLNFDQGGFASFILLAGITVNAAIYILNEYNTLRRRYPKVAPIRNYVRALRVKVVPILLTVVSTILGFIPFIIGETRESFWFPLAVGTMGGLAMSLLSIFIIFPIFLLPKQKRK